MRRLILLALSLSLTVAWAQDSTPEDEAAPEAATETEELTEAEQKAREKELIEAVLEDEPIDYSGEDERVFESTEEVLFGQSVPFPPDI